MGPAWKVRRLHAMIERTATAGGAPEAAFVVVASRVKPGWDEGAFVMAAQAWFRLGRPFDQRYPDGLRRVYPLIVPGAAEVIRRQVAYELPALSERYPTRTRAGIQQPGA